MRFTAGLLSLVVLVLPFGCDEDAAGVEFDLPQIVPQSNVLCLSYIPVEAGSRSEQSVQLTNRGREPLRLEGAEIENDLRGSFEIGAIRLADQEVDCTPTQPCFLETGRDAYLRYFYRPSEPGWDTVDLRVSSNAENYPRLKLFVLALAYPAGGDPMTYEPGDKPAVAVGADGSETCPP